MTMGLSDEAIEEKFQKIQAGTGIDLQTDEEREEAEQDAADAEEQRKKDEEAAAAAEEDEDTDEPEAKQQPASPKTGSTVKASGK
jgi:hypothetical protein